MGYTLIISILIILNIVVEPCWGEILGIAVRLPLQGPRAPPGSPWPLPQVWNPTPTLRTLDPTSFKFTTDTPGCDVLEGAFRRYGNILQIDEGAAPDGDLETVTELRVSVSNKKCGKDHYPSVDMDESYTLTIGSGPQASLNTATIWGALRGLETFSQLVYLTENKKVNLNATEIQDYPRFPHRGIMIDTARHFLPMSVLLKNLDAMAYNKFNVLHWHVVDDQAFPYPLTSIPNMTEYGTFSPKHRYSRQDVTTLVQEARLRGIRVVPEFDTPGHTWSWGQALPDLLTPCWKDGEPYQPNYGLTGHGPMEILNPMEEYTFQVLEIIWKEIIEDFPDQFVHLGLDEIYHWCWVSNPNISAWMVDMNMTTYSEIEEYYATRLIDIVSKYTDHYMMWNDPIVKGVQVDNNTIVEVWKTTNTSAWEPYALQVAEQGYRFILSSPWYLNYIAYGADWTKFYLVEPTNFTTDESLRRLVLGGEACLWAEYVDGTNFLPRLWPRASAVGERLWSNETVRDPEEAKFRLDQQRCRMVRRGLPAQPILPGYCGDYDWGMEAPPQTTPTPTACPTQGSVSVATRPVDVATCTWLLLLLSIYISISSISGGHF